MSIESRMTEELQDLQDEAQSLRERVAALEADLAASVPRAVAERACAIAASGGFAFGCVTPGIQKPSSEHVLDALIEAMGSGDTAGQECGHAMDTIAHAALAAALKEAAE
jgi:hypothetical protein